MMMYQPMRASILERRSRLTRLRAQVRTMRTMSRQKKTITASSVPIWVTAVKAAPGSCQPSSCESTRMCALEEIGRNSVKPCTTPRKTASNHDIVKKPDPTHQESRPSFAGWQRARPKCPSRWRPIRCRRPRRSMQKVDHEYDHAGRSKPFDR